MKGSTEEPQYPHRARTASDTPPQGPVLSPNDPNPSEGRQKGFRKSRILKNAPSCLPEAGECAPSCLPEAAGCSQNCCRSLWSILNGAMQKALGQVMDKALQTTPLAVLSEGVSKLQKPPQHYTSIGDCLSAISGPTITGSCTWQSCPMLHIFLVGLLKAPPMSWSPQI